MVTKLIEICVSFSILVGIMSYYYREAPEIGKYGCASRGSERFIVLAWNGTNYFFQQAIPELIICSAIVLKMLIHFGFKILMGSR